MELFKRDRSTAWYVDLVHPVTGARMRRSLKFKGSKVEAQKRARKLEASLEAVAEDGQTLTVKQAIDNYIEVLVARKQDSQDARYRRDKLLGLSASSTGRYTLDPDTPFHTLTPAGMEKLVLARLTEGKKPQTIKHELGLLKASANYAERWGNKVPANIKKWPVPEVGRKTRYLSPEEFHRVVTYLDPDRPVDTGPLPLHQRKARAEVRDLVVALAYTGGRWSEIAGLRWGQVDLAGGTIKLWAGKVKRERLVPVAATLDYILRRRLTEWDTSPVHLVFPGPGGRARTQPTQAISKAMDACGLNSQDMVERHGRATIHSLRHTFATWLIQNGADLGEVAHALGHSSLTMTQRYAHLSQSATLAKLGGILNGVAPCEPALSSSSP